MSRRNHDNDTLEVLRELSIDVGAGLTKQQLAVAMSLLHQGVNPSALVAITQELRREAHFAAEQHQRTDRQSH
ncbi:hypothetical protein IWW55_006657 [Coemansia sp. RSA 2706]|nr:hypothetical protein LPJ63_000697 [Coemansia sp. RSA 2711]KAJ2287727.1 hypothetical protein IWW55_006657 [Coemansia sp. RSA 2706]